MFAAALSAAALLSAAPAPADPTDDAFISALSDYGIAVNDPDSMIGMAQSVCAGLDNNQRSSLLAMKVMKETTFSPRQAGFFVGLAVSSYCPQDRERARDSLDWLNMPPPLM